MIQKSYLVYQTLELLTAGIGTKILIDIVGLRGGNQNHFNGRDHYKIKFLRKT